MATRRTVLRSTGIVQEAVAQKANGKTVKVSFKYTDKKGQTSTRKALNVVEVYEAPGTQSMVVKTVNDLGVFRSFNTARMTHAKIVK